MMIELDKLWGAITVAIVGGGSWLIRRVLTNEKQIALLEQALKTRDGDIREMRSDIKRILERK
jgi:hypothetical protein